MTVAILWFRRDLRLTDNPALQAALEHASELIPVYIHTPGEEAPWSPGAASNWWLHESLTALDSSLRQRGSNLIIARGKSQTVLKKLAITHASKEIFFNSLPEPIAIQRDNRVSKHLSKSGINCNIFNNSQLTDGPPIRRLDGGCYRLFTPFWRAVLKQGLSTRAPLPAPKKIPPPPKLIKSISLQSLGLLPEVQWYEHFKDYWEPGEHGALKQIQHFLDKSINSYAEGRNRPDLEETSRLSPHLHFGEIGPLQIINGIESRFETDTTSHADSSPGQYIRQLVWREFAQNLLIHFPDTDLHPFDPRFQNYPWRKGKRAEKLLQYWQQGKTGIPIVDAGMRELWQTGWMHNRVRMIVASFLTKNLGIHWLQGARWFWDTLVDADCANNSFGWQWCAGSGTDAAPYFRIFNPVRQSQRFDPQGEYIRRWLPELSLLPNKYLNAPWEADMSVLLNAEIRLGKTYPKPIVDLQLSRKEALQRWETIKNLSSKRYARK